MQIYGILLNIRGILLNIRGKTEKYGEFHSSNSCQLTHFRGRFRSFSVVFAVIPGEFQRKSENIGDIFPFSFLFFPLHYTFIPFYSSNPRFSSPNVKSY